MLNNSNVSIFGSSVKPVEQVSGPSNICKPHDESTIKRNIVFNNRYHPSVVFIKTQNSFYRMIQILPRIARF